MISKFLNELKMKGWKQAVIADKIGVSKSFLCELANGKKCSVDIVLKLADAFEVTTDTVLGRSAEKTISPTEELLLKLTDGNEEIARRALRCAQGEKSLLDQEGKGEGKKAVNN